MVQLFPLLPLAEINGPEIIGLWRGQKGQFWAPGLLWGHGSWWVIHVVITRPLCSWEGTEGKKAMAEALSFAWSGGFTIRCICLHVPLNWVQWGICELWHTIVLDIHFHFLRNAFLPLPSMASLVCVHMCWKVNSGPTHATAPHTQVNIILCRKPPTPLFLYRQSPCFSPVSPTALHPN